MEQEKRNALAAIDRAAECLCSLSDAIWDVPETAFCETTAADLQCALLQQQGFAVQRGLAGIPTAFCGRWGSGGPVIGLLGEFDALSGLSQQANVAQKCPITPGGNGHGCGHNLLGAGSIAAALAVKAYLEASGTPGTVIYYGCPGEEGGSGKAFMARDGVFDGLDAAFSWHPMDYTAAWYESTLANVQVRYRFKGISAHAANSPHLGRSALDAVELMNVGVQFLREHILPEVRIHYAITDAGGLSPNVVQPNAEVLYLIRAPKMPDVQQVYQRVNDIARGAALMTGTQVQIQFVKACSNFVMNDVLADLLQTNLEQTPPPQYTDQELAFAQAIRASLENPADPLDAILPKLPPAQAAQVRRQTTGPLYSAVLPRIHSNAVLAGSTDVGDVSWVCPVGQVLTAAWAAGTPAHSWQAVAQGKSSVAHKNLLYAGKVLAGAVIDLLRSPQLLQAARAEHAERRDHKPYEPPIPPEVQPAGLQAR